MKQAAGLFIALCWVVFFLFIIVSAFSVKRTVQVARVWRWSWLALIPGGAAFLFAHGWPLSARSVGKPLWPFTPWVGAAADLVSLIGVCIALWGRVALGRNWNINPALKEDHQLIQGGPYAYVRHPMYSGLCLMLLSTVLWFGNGIGWLFFAACFLGTWLKLRTEEMLLTMHFGDEYVRYKGRVKALVPYLL